MKTTFMRTLLAVVATALMASWAAAQGQQSAYMSEMGGGGGMPGAYPEMYGGECYGGDCCGGECYGGGECGDYGYGDCQCGGNPCGCDQSNSCCDNYDQNCGMFYAEIQNTFLRPHIMENAVGKLSEKYEWSPRGVLGYEAPSGVGGRARYWKFGRTTEILNQGGDEIELDFEVIDLEGTGRFRTTHADLIVSGGFRWANIEIEEDDDSVRSDMPGLTVAADLRGVFCRGGRSEWASVAGARWSLLGGDWEGDGNDLIDEVRDDNVVVHELYGGVEWLCRGGRCDFYARAVFEMQNWHSDALGDTSATDTIGFVGPALHGGFTF